MMSFRAFLQPNCSHHSNKHKMVMYKFLFISYLFLTAACSEENNNPEFKESIAFQKGCGLKFSSRNQISWLSVTHDGQISYKSNDRKMTTDPDREIIISIVADQHAEQKWILSLANKVSMEKIIIGSISRHDLDRIIRECKISVSWNEQ